MLTLEALRGKIDSAEELLSVVKTMKALAAVSIRQYERAVESLAEYARTVEMGLQVVLQAEGNAPHASERPGRLAAVVFGSDLGMAGQVNDRICSHALQELSGIRGDTGERIVAAVGTRVAAALEDAGQPTGDLFPVPGSVAGISPVVADLLLKIEEWQSSQGVGRVVLFHNRPRGGASYQPHTVPLLPVDRAWLRDVQTRQWPSRSLPTFRAHPSRLFSALVRQHLFIGVYRALAEALASESASRLVSMQAAEKNIKERLVEMDAGFHRQRQDSITAEILDIVAGSGALG